MRAAILLICLVFALPSDAAERTWTIARDVYQADGELVAVRGDLAYVKIDGRVEEIPIERLSASDQQYINSLSFAPILPGPAGDATSTSVSPAVAHPNVVQEEMPLPGPPDPPRGEELELNAPDLAPAYGGTPLRAQTTPQSRTRFDRYGRTAPPQPGTQAN